MSKTMTTIFLAGIIVSTTAFAQNSSDQPSSSTAPPAIATDTMANKTDAAPVKGHNSFTKHQAMKRIAAKGFTGVKNLVKDKDGIWRGKAMKDGAEVDVSLDYQGNVTGG